MRLNEQRDLLRDQNTTAIALIREFQEFLDGPKFRGHDARNGTPNNWIATPDVESWLRQIKDALEDDCT